MNSNIVHHQQPHTNHYQQQQQQQPGGQIMSSSLTATPTPDRPPPPIPTNSAQITYRSPPPIPTSPPPHDDIDYTSTTPPPQAPARSATKTSRSKLAGVSSASTSARSIDPTPTLSVATNRAQIEQTTPNMNSIQSHESAKNAAVKLVQNKIMMGSVPSLTNNNQNVVNNENEPPPPHIPKIMQNMDSIGSGDMSNRNMIINSNLNQTPMIMIERPSAASQSSSAQVSSSTSGHGGKNLARTNSSAHHRPSQPAQNNLPWNPISGETINREDNEPIYAEITFVRPDNLGVRGKLYISNFRLYFISDETCSFSNFNSHLIIDVPLGLIHRIEKIGHQSSKQMNFYGILISCKNGRRLRFSANTQLKVSRKQIYEQLQRYAFPLSYGSNFFAFKFTETFGDNSGWQCYDIRQEYERMGISKTDEWRFTEINKDFQFCDTYPKLLVVPKKIDDAELRLVAEFRSKHRIPVVSWLKYDNNKNSVALLRSSQPLTGLMQKRSERDEAYLRMVFSLNHSNSGEKLYILDARPNTNAYANRATGGGFENPDNYQFCEIHFLNIHNIHVMRESLRKIFDMAMPPTVAVSSSSSGSGPSSSGGNNAGSGQASTAIGNLVTTNPTHHRSTSFGAGGDAGRGNSNNGSSGTNNNSNGGANPSNQSNSSLNDDRNFFVNLENSKWLEHIKSVLNGALRIVRYITVKNASVLVHCSDGWDRTAQLTSLAMLMMDKYYRTIKGFQVLIEKEWISFGHRFGIRMGHGSEKYADQDRSPIFLQFIDCVWQIMQQNGKVFEFNEKFLLFIVNNMYACQFGTFLYNNECERERYDVRNKTVSVWSYINSKDYRNEYRNNAYIEYDGVVECSTSLSSLQLWVAYYFQYREVYDDTLNSLSAQNPAMLGSGLKSSSNSQNMYTSTLPMPSNKMFGQAFFQQVVSQMKATVRNHGPQEPELVRYKACVHSAD